MKKRFLNTFGLLLLIVFSYFTSYSQPVANFSTSNPGNIFCTGTTVYFYNESTNCFGAPSYNWNFGDGRVSSLENPALSFNTGGTFVVTLTINCSNGSANTSIEIHVNQSPTANFEADTVTGCVPLDVNFTDLSTQGTGAITKWLWYFGDGHTSSQSSPQHTYNASGNYTVSLQITDENSCKNTKIRNTYISVANAPVVDFTADNTETCESTLEVNFTSTVSTSFNIGYDYYWDFGDGTYSTEANPQKTFSEGIFTVSLTIIDEYGCETTVVKEDYIRVVDPVPEYVIIADGTVIDNDTLCINTDYYFVNLTGYDCLWDFGSYQTTNDSALYNFSQGGDVVVTFTVDVGGPCEISTEIVLFIEEAEAYFITDPSDFEIFSCTFPFVVDFINQSSDNAVSYLYDFGDGNSSSDENNTHSYTNPGVYNPTLMITTANNCFDIYEGPQITISDTMDISFRARPSAGCVPLVVIFEYTGGVSPDDIVSLEWNFDDGTIISNGDTIEFHTFDAIGTYEVTLTVTDINGCVQTIDLTVRVGEIYVPTIDVVTLGDRLPLISVFPDLHLCASDSVELYLQDFNDPDLEDIRFHWYITTYVDTMRFEAGSQYTVWQFDQDTGWYFIHMITNNNGCRDTIFWDSVHISGPIIEEIGYTYKCHDPLDFDFVIYHIAGNRFDWKVYYFEDETEHIIDFENNTTSASFNVILSDPGGYWVKVTAYNDISGCEYTDSVWIRTVHLEAIFSIDYSPCIYETMTFNASSSIDAYEYRWSYGDGNYSAWTTNPQQEYAYSVVGDLVVELYVRPYGQTWCRDTISDNITVRGVLPDITATPTYGCNTLDVDFTDMSSPEDNRDSITWNFGDGNNGEGFSINHTYENPGIFSVSTIVYTFDGCAVPRNYPDLITVVEISANFSTNNNTGCVGSQMGVIPSINNPNFTYTWNFGDGNQSNAINATNQYSSGGVYNVSLNIVDNMGICSESHTIPNFFIIEEPFADFYFNSDVLPCWPGDPGITANASVIPAATTLSYHWNMGNGDIVLVKNPQYLYYMPGEYDVTLTVTTPNGCTDTYTKTLIVQGPYAEIYVSEDTVCVGEEITFQIISQQEVESFVWIFDDGAYSGEDSTTHSYSAAPLSGYYNVSLSLVAGICNPSIPIQIWVIDKPEINITPAGPFCMDDMEIELTVFPGGGTWTGQGIIDSIAGIFNPIVAGASSHNIVYEVTVNNCTGSDSITIYVYSNPDATITPVGPFCETNTTITLTAVSPGGVWSGQGITDTIAGTFNPIIAGGGNHTITYEIRVDDCPDENTIQIVVFPFDVEVDYVTQAPTCKDGNDGHISITVTGGTPPYIFEWNNQFFSENELITGVGSGKHTVIITDANNCQHIITTDAIAQGLEVCIRIPNAFTPNGDGINDFWLIENINTDPYHCVQVFNRWGQEVYKGRYGDAPWNGTYNGEPMPTGPYLYLVRIGLTRETYIGTVTIVR